MAYSLPHLFAAGGRVYFVTGTKTQTGGQTDRKGNKTPVYSWRPRFVGLDIAGGKEVWRCQDEALGEMAWIGLYADCPDGGVLLGFDEGGYLGVSVVGQAKPWYLRVRTQSKGKGEDKPFADLRRAFGCLACAGGLLWVRDSLGTLWGDQQTPTSPGDVQVIGWRGIDPRTGKPGPRIGYPLMRPWGGIHPRSGQFVASLDMAVERNWSGRCYVDVAGRNCILSQTMEIVGLDGKHLEHVHGIRGQCGIGFILGNNSLYTPPNQCIGCYPMVRGAVAYETSQATRGAAVADDARLEKGPAYGQTDNRQPPVDSSRDWPMFRHDPLRTGCTPLKLPPGGVKLKWTAQVGSRCTQPVVAGGRAVTAVVGEGRVVCLDAAAGKTLWDFAAGSRIDSSPTLCGDLVLFGYHDGYLYCLRAGDGALAWRFNAAAAHRRIVVNDRVESPWPVFGSVLACDGAVFAMAGQYSALDGGLRFWGLEAATGKVRFGRVFAGIKGEKAVILPTFWYTHQEQGLNNILVADKGRIRLYEEWGGWEFSSADGHMLGQLQAVPQPGWPQGRITPGDPNTVDRWPWAGFDRVSLQYLMQGVPYTLQQSLELDPRTRFSGRAGNFMFFPDKRGPGVFLRAKGGATEVEPEPWVQPTELKIIGSPSQFAKYPARVAARARLWATRTLPIAVQSFAMAGKETLWLAGTVPPPAANATAGQAAEQAPAAKPAAPPPSSALVALSMADGTELARWTFDGVATFDGMSAAAGRLFVATRDGRVLCFGR